MEKPKEDALLDSLRLPAAMQTNSALPGGESFLASMGIYVFNRKVICELLDNPLSDFGKHIIPHAIKSRRVFSYVYQGYWEDIGTIRNFFEANLDLVSELPRFNFFDMSAPIFSRPRYLPGSKINGAQIDHAVVSDGCIINHAAITQHHRRPAHHRRRGHGIEPSHHSRQRLLRIAGIGERTTSRPAGRASASVKIAGSRTPSLTRTRASATT